jgi:DNA-binding transcriptional LysR family regulator
VARARADAAVDDRRLLRIDALLLKVNRTQLMALGSTEAIKRVVAEGVGLAIMSRLAVSAECAAGSLAVLPVAGLRIPRPLHLVRRKRPPRRTGLAGVLRSPAGEDGRPIRVGE